MRKINFIQFVLFFGLVSCSSGLMYAQSSARDILDTLCSPGYAGRAYVNRGEERAADFVAKQFKSAGLEPITDKYFQEYRVNANIFPGKMEVSLNRTIIKPGRDYLVDPDAPSVSGSFPVYPLPRQIAQDPTALPQTLVNSGEVFFLIDESEYDLSLEPDRKLLEEILALLKFFDHPLFYFKGILLLTSEKLTWSPSPIQGLRPLIRINKAVSPPIIKKVHLDIEAKFLKSFPSKNVIGKITGSTQPDSFIVVTAHYDHLGMMGNKVYFPGANDNASGVAMLIDLAGKFTQPENRPGKSIVFIAFGSEEIGLKGSEFFTKFPPFPLTNIKFLINLDILGTGDDGIQVVNGTIYKEQYDKLVSLNHNKNYLKEVKIRGEMCKSDHCFFQQKGVPCFYIYTLGGVAYYHDIYDHPHTLPLSEFKDLSNLLSDYIQYLDSSPEE